MSAKFKPKVNLTPGAQARVAFMRFGLGPKPGGAPRLAAADGEAFQACLNEIQNPAALLIPEDEVKTYGTDTRADLILDYASCCRFGCVWRDPATTGFLPQSTDVIDAEQAVAYAKSLEPEVGFAERLVQFWSNHFSVFSAKSGMVEATAGHLERAVIRPRVLGKFSDLLKAVYTHPAMICYLDNQESVGPKSPNGLRTRKSYNENLAREILELHTLGIDGGYTQGDVTSFAKILTGWTIYPAYSSTNVIHPKAGQFYFEPTFHEPGPQTVLGVTYSQSGMDQGLAVLDSLARHPATAQHIAYKLIRHFVADEPQPQLVAFLARLFRITGGDLHMMAKAMISLPQFWTEPMVRVVKPVPWQMSTLRGMGVSKQTVLARKDVSGILAYQNARILQWYVILLGQGMWRNITPEGSPDENFFWMNANSVRIRKDAAAGNVAIAYPNSKSPKPPTAMAADLLFGFRSDATASAMAELEQKKFSDSALLSMLFVSPEYILR
jgi:uncharacterized protein (DUF1800 family)